MHQSITLSTPAAKAGKKPIIYKILVVLGLLSVMGGSLTGIMTYINLGYRDSFFSDWLSAFLTAVVTIMPLGLLMVTLLTRWVNKRLPHYSERRRNLIVGICMASLMESGMALTTTLNTMGFTDSAALLANWLQTLLGALPLALLLMCVISLTIKPRVERFLQS